MISVRLFVSPARQVFEKVGDGVGEDQVLHDVVIWRINPRPFSKRAAALVLLVRATPSSRGERDREG